jgi:murein DD-endopeptidase MepM/ murein hydrolase activator NlpD
VADDQAILAVLNEVTAKLQVHQAALNAAQAELTKVTLQIKAERRRIAALNARRRARQAVIDARVRAMYISGPVDGIMSVGAGQTLDEYLGRAGVLEYVAQFDQQLLEDLAALRFESMKAAEALRKQREAAAEKRDEIGERVEIVRELVATQQAAHQKLSSEIQGYRSEVEALEREQARIEAIIRQRATLGNVTTGGSSSYGFAWPIRGLITSPYGPRWGSFHTGIDIDCQTGDGIGASKAGRVIESGWGGGYGNMIIIDHGGGYATLYAHMSRLYVGSGTSVSQHQKVGACGTTGNSTGDHLHFEIRVNGQHRDPRPYLP